jgi:4a-hydroxytetrahydrobiopterin dehydratase
MESLSGLRCVACRRDAPTVTADEISILHLQVPEWELLEVDGVNRLRRVFTFGDFASALAFTGRVGTAAEEQGHHPSLLTEWGRVTVSWWTHKIRGLHRNDFIMAAKTDRLYLHDPPPPFSATGDGELLAFGDVRIVVRASSAATGGAFSLMEELPPLVDTPAHVHRNEDEVFYVLEGEHVVTVGDVEHPVGPGDLVFAPRGMPHAQKRVAPGAGRFLVLTVPGGFDGFFRELAAAHDAGTLGPDAYRSASERFGITWL